MTETEVERLRLRVESLEREAAQLRSQAHDGVRWRALVEGAPRAAVVETDRDGRVTAWSPGAARLLGWSAAEMEGAPLSRIRFSGPGSRERDGHAMREALAEGHATEDCRLLTRDGARVPAASETAPLRDPAGVPLGFVWLLRPDTDRARGQALQDVAAHLRRAEEVGQVGVFSIDADGDMLRATPAFCRLYGLPVRDSVPVADIEARIVAEDRGLASTPESRRRGDAIGHVEYRVRDPDTGAIRWIARSGEVERGPDGRPLRIVGVARDITEQVAARRALDSEREQLAQMFEQAPTFMAILRGPEHRIERVNPGYLRLVGHRQVLGRPVAEALPEAIEQGFVRLLDDVYRSGRPYAARDARYVALDGQDGAPVERRVDFVYQPIRDVDGRVSGIFVEGVDSTERQQAEAKLVANEQRYRFLFDSIDEGFCIIEFFDGPHGPLSDYVHVEANAAYARHAGIPDVVGQKLREMVPDEADGWVELYGGVLRTGVPIRFERELVATGRHLELAAFRLEPASQRQVAVLFQDITARKRAEAVLRESEEQFRILAQGLPNQVWAARPDGSLTWFNQQAYTYTGAAPDAPGRAFDLSGVVHPGDLPEARARWRAALAAGTVYETEIRIRRADGAFRWFLVRAEPVRDPDGAVTRWIGTNTDIDDRRRAATELTRHLETRVEQRTRERDRLWETTNDLMGTAGLDGYMRSVNPAWTAVLGWTEAELLSRPFLDIVDPADHAAVTAVVGRLQAGETVTGFVDRVLDRDGQARVIMWTAVPDEGTGLFHIVGRDLTDQRAAEEALRQSQKMEAVGQLTGGLAHDFNNLLAGISGSLELLQARLSQGRLTEIERYIVAAQGAAKRAAALTHRLLAFSRRQTLDPRPTDVNRLVTGMEELVRRSVGPAVALEVVTAGGLWTVRIDPPQLENALLNLCLNARDAMPDGGRITVETANRWLDERAARARDLPAGQYVSLCVTDTGTGMPPEVIARVFDPFFTTKPIGQGTGLGLSMIYGFVRQSGGQVRIYSEVGKGTTMCLYLPRHYGQAAEEGLDPASAAARPSGTGETVLVVDDEPTVRMLVTDVLEELGYLALEAADGASGLHLLESPARIDLLVTDVGLPGGMNGRQLADAARTRRPDLKVLFITGYAENSVIGNGHLDPGMQVLTKPFEMEVLANRIRGMIEDR